MHNRLYLQALFLHDVLPQIKPRMPQLVKTASELKNPLLRNQHTDLLGINLVRRATLSQATLC